MKEAMFSYDTLRDKGYEMVLKLPSYSVVQHPGTFHTVIFHYNRIKKTYSFVSEHVIPGLKGDPPVEIPAGMWKELVKRDGKSGGIDSILDNPPMRWPTPRLGNARVHAGPTPAAPETFAGGIAGNAATRVVYYDTETAQMELPATPEPLEPGEPSNYYNERLRQVIRANAERLGAGAVTPTAPQVEEEF